jgi:hypothetical protein
MSDSYVKYDKEGHLVGFVGPDATRMFQAMVLRNGLGLMSKGIKPNRGWTIYGALKTASMFTGKKYKRTEVEKARDDLKLWIDTMKAALPNEEE